MFLNALHQLLGVFHHPIISFNMQLSFSSSYILPGFDTRFPPAGDAQIKTAAELIDFNADNNPNYLFCLQAEKSLDGGKGPPVLRITHKSLRSMILSCQLWLLKHIKELQLPIEGDGGNIIKGPPIALLLDSDVGLLVHFFALLGLGIPVSLPIVYKRCLHLQESTSGIYCKHLR